jgi:hypothetical protein
MALIPNEPVFVKPLVCDNIFYLKCYMSYFRQRQINPLIPICVIGLILLLIASTIVLALIPVYLQTRNANNQDFSKHLLIDVDN